MAMTTGSGRQGDVLVDMNTTPLIDVMLVLLTLLIITIPIQTHAVKLDMPTGVVPPTTPVTVELYVDFDGTKTWDGNVVKSMADLDSYFRNAATDPAQPEIHLGVNRLARYEWVAEVLAHAQRLDVTRIGFVGMDQFK